MQSAECLCSQALYCLLSHHLPACCLCQQREVRERRHQMLISCLPPPLVNISGKTFTGCFIFSYQGFGHLGIFFVCVDFTTHAIPFTISANGLGLPTSLTQFQICRGVLCPKELNVLVHHIYPWQTIPGHRIPADVRNACT